MPITIEDLLCGIGATTSAPNGGVWSKLSQRPDIFETGRGPQWIADAVIELSRDFPFDQLQRTTPAPVQMTTGQYQYPVTTWLISGDLIANLIPSFYMFYSNVLVSGPGYQPGVGLTYKSIDSLELMFSTPGAPAYWSRYGGDIFIAPQPDQNYFSYMRYQRQHPFSNPPALSDPILLPDEWREIIEYSAAMRGAGNLRMLDYAKDYHSILFGDPKDPTTPGLIAKRVSSEQADIVANQGMRQMRPVMRLW